MQNTKEEKEFYNKIELTDYFGLSFLPENLKIFIDKTSKNNDTCYVYFDGIMVYHAKKYFWSGGFIEVVHLSSEEKEWLNIIEGIYPKALGIKEDFKRRLEDLFEKAGAGKSL